MERFERVYIGYIDILGYHRLEQHLGLHAVHFITRIFQSFDGRINRNLTSINWIRVQDGYFFHSLNSDTDVLESIIKECCKIIALSLSQYIPVRVVMTQETVHIDHQEGIGTTITGQGRVVLERLEKLLDWMGGFLYLPNVNQDQHQIMQNLISSIHLVKQQVNGLNNQTFKPPFKEITIQDTDPDGIKAEKQFKTNIINNTRGQYFLNWFRILRQPKDALDSYITGWWAQHGTDRSFNDSDDVRSKQNNTIAFADYCRMLRKAAYLIHFSGINRIELGDIDRIP